MKYLPKTTLGYFQSAPQLKLNDLSGIPVKQLAKSTKEFREVCGLVYPDEQAVTFYALNHCASIVKANFTPSETLPAWALKVMDAYTGSLMFQAERSMHYLISIITREARHTHEPGAELMSKMKAIGGQEMMNFLTKIRNSGEDAAVNSYMAYSGDLTAGAYTEAIEYVFNHGKWSGGYGGKPWGKIAATLLSVLKGKTTLEMMVDTSYTLAHNNGPMFNKGMMYDHHGSDLIMILDVQRSGQIPELLIDSTNWVASKALKSSVRALVKEVKDAVPGAFGGWVDWEKVKDLGAVGNYHTQLTKQKQMHPGKPKVVMFNGKPAVSTGVFQVWPGQAVNTYKRVA